jgi:CYTH domain-containing protein/thymidylate kinase
MPETATLLIKGAFPDLAKLALDEYPHFLAVQKQILALQMAFLRSFREVGRAFAGQPQVIICDRGMMDSLAYVRERRDFIEILRALHLPQREARDSFDGVIHLVTAADGAEEFYTLANNIARSETPEQARELDSRTQAAWLGHPHLKVIDNSTAFDLKMHRTIQAVTRILGIPVPLEIERKFLVELPIDWSHPVLASAALVEIEQQYVRLYGTDQVARIRRRGQRGSWTYTQTSKERQSALTRTEIEHRITREEYDALSLYRLASTRLIRKHRHCFIWESQYFELDVFSDLPELALLEIELTEEHDKVTIPPFLKTSREVTEDPSYENRTLATIRL